MGLAKDIPYKDSGITLSYWRINAVTVDLEADFCRVRVSGYPSKADALQGKTPLMFFEAEYRGAHNPIEINSDPREWKNLVYDKVRASYAGEEGETELERVQRLISSPKETILAGATIVSDLPD